MKLLQTLLKILTVVVFFIFITSVLNLYICVSILRLVLVPNRQLLSGECGSNRD